MGPLSHPSSGPSGLPLPHDGPQTAVAGVVRGGLHSGHDGQQLHLAFRVESRPTPGTPQRLGSCPTHHRTTPGPIPSTEPKESLRTPPTDRTPSTDQNLAEAAAAAQPALLDEGDLLLQVRASEGRPHQVAHLEDEAEAGRVQLPARIRLQPASAAASRRSPRLACPG